MNAHTRIFTKRAPTPWHLWFVALLAVLWNGFGALTYLAFHWPIEGLLADYSAAERGFLEAMPLWANAAWAIAVWFALAASLALLFRRRWAVGLFAISLLGMVATSIRNFIFADGLEVVGTEGAILAGAVFLVGVLLLAYSRAMARRRVLH